MAGITVRFVGYRVQPLDPDNFAGSVKDLLDGIRHAGLIPDDTIWAINLQTSQRKVKHRCDERTEITIENASIFVKSPPIKKVKPPAFQ